MISAFPSLLLALAQPVVSQPVARPGTPSCPASSARAVAVEEIWAAPDWYLGLCVTVSGIAGQAQMFSSIASFYRFGRGGPESDRFRIGLVGLPGRGGLPRELAIAMTVTGTVDDCRRVNEAAFALGGPDTVLQIAPYCQFAYGPVIVVSAHRIDSAQRPQRLVGEENRRRHGSIAFAPDGWDALPQLRAAAELFRGAIARGDRQALAAMHGQAEGLLDPRLLPFLLDDDNSVSPFVELRGERTVQTAIFVHTGAVRERLVRSGRERTALLCFCRTGDCSGTWPIAMRDADNDPDRPYACTDFYATGRVRFSTSFGPGFLAEPAASTFHRLSDSSRR